jgi:hypothetical protein
MAMKTSEATRFFDRRIRMRFQFGILTLELIIAERSLRFD